MRREPRSYTGALEPVLAVCALLAIGCSDDDEGGTPPFDSGAAMSTGDAASGADDAGDDGRICAACDGSCEEALTLAPAEHRLGSIDYADKPPAGGPHAPCWASYGPYVGAAVPAEEWVHNLEHGAVVFLYNCPDGCDQDMATLAGIALALPRVIVTEYTDMPPGFAAVSWGHRLVSTCLDVDAMTEFHDEHFDHAPESIGSGRPNGC